MDIKHEHVDNYYIEYYDSGIILLMFNTKERWCDYCRQGDHDFLIGNNCKEDEYWDNYIIKIPKEELKLDWGKEGYTVLEAQEKDQIYFYYVPFKLITKTIG